MIDSKVGSNFRITGIGEVLWNVFPGGKRFGGMPSNFVCQAQALGANAQIVSCVGQNQLGQKSYHFQKHVRSKHHQSPFLTSIQTGTVRVQLDPSGHPKFEICADSAWDFIPWPEKIAILTSTASAVCYGTLSQQSQMS